MAANSELRERGGRGWACPVWVPPVELCTDNAAMIAGAARFLEPLAYPDYLALDASARPTGPHDPDASPSTASPAATCATTRARSSSGARPTHPFELEEVDVSLDPALNREYGERIPVVALDGEELLRVLRRCRGARRGSSIEWTP